MNTRCCRFNRSFVGTSVVATWLYNAADGRVLVPVVFHTLSNAVSVTTASGVVGDGVRSQVALLLVVWAFAGLLVWRYGTETLSDGPLPDGGLSFARAGGRGSVRDDPDLRTGVEGSDRARPLGSRLFHRRIYII